MKSLKASLVGRLDQSKNNESASKGVRGGASEEASKDSSPLKI